MDGGGASVPRTHSTRSTTSSVRSASRTQSESRRSSSPRQSLGSRKKGLTKVQQVHPDFFKMVLIQSTVEDCLLTAKFSPNDRVAHGVPHMHPPDKAQEAAKHVQLTHHRPHLFKELRAHFDVDVDDYFRSVCCTHWYQLGNEEGRTFLAGDRYAIHIMGKRESNLLADIVEDYQKYVKTNRQSTLPRLFGHHEAQVQGQDLCFIVYENLLRLDRPLTRAFQLSHLSEFRPRSLPASGITTVSDATIAVGPQQKDALLTQLKRDIDFLKERKMSKYMLDVGLQLPKAGDPPSGWPAQEEQLGVYRVGISGILNGVPSLSSKLFGPKMHAKKLYSMVESLVA